MTMVIPKTAVGVFADRQEAENAVAELRHAGFQADEIGVAVRHVSGDEEEPAPPGHETKAEEGGIAGVFTGGVLGGLLGAGAVAAGLIPGLGPVIGAGILIMIASGTAAGAVAGGLVGTLIGLGIPEEEARHYQTEFEGGKTIVTVKTPDRHTEAVAILRRHGAYGKGSPLI